MGALQQFAAGSTSRQTAGHHHRTLRARQTRTLQCLTASQAESLYVPPFLQEHVFPAYSPQSHAIRRCERPRPCIPRTPPTARHRSKPPTHHETRLEPHSCSIAWRTHAANTCCRQQARRRPRPASEHDSACPADGTHRAMAQRRSANQAPYQLPNSHQPCRTQSTPARTTYVPGTAPGPSRPPAEGISSQRPRPSQPWHPGKHRTYLLSCATPAPASFAQQRPPTCTIIQTRATFPMPPSQHWLDTHNSLFLRSPHFYPTHSRASRRARTGASHLCPLRRCLRTRACTRSPAPGPPP